MKKRAVFLFLAFVAALVGTPLVTAEDEPSSTPTPGTVGEGDEELPEEAAEIAVATPTPPPQEELVDEHNVEPLDAWYVVPDKSPTPTPAEQERTDVDRRAPRADSELLDEEDEEVLELENVETDAQLPENAANKAALDSAQRAHRVQLTKFQKARIREARIKRHRVMKETANLIGLKPPIQGDTRGEAELRLCTLNFNNYGTADDYRRMFKAAQLPRRERIESGIISAIATAGCELVAFQALLGTSDTSAELAIKKLIRRLIARVGGQWESFLGSASGQVVRNGYLVRTDRMTVKKHVSYDEVRLTNFGKFSLKEFTRPPVLLPVDVAGKNEAKAREVVFLNFDFRQSMVSVRPEPEPYRMQMADGVRQVIHTVERSYPPDDQPILILLGDRMGAQPAPATRLLEGRQRLLDFTVDGGCQLSPENKVECATKWVHFKEFFGVSAEGYQLSPKEKKIKEEDVEKNVLVYPSKAKERKAQRPLREKTAEIYLRGSDVEYAQANMYFPGRYRTGTMPGRTGLDKSPLVWVDLNW